MKEEVGLSHQVLGSSQDSLEVVVVGPFIFIEKEVIRRRVTIGRIIEAVKEPLMISKLIIDVGPYDSGVAVADTINPAHKLSAPPKKRW